MELRTDSSLNCRKHWTFFSSHRNGGFHRQDIPPVTDPSEIRTHHRTLALVVAVVEGGLSSAGAVVEVADRAWEAEEAVDRASVGAEVVEKMSCKRHLWPLTSPAKL